MRYVNFLRYALQILSLMTLALSAGCGGGGGGGGGKVADASLLSITMTPPSSTIDVGSVSQFSVIGNYSDNSSRDITNSVDWSASPNGVASVGNSPGSKGTATAKAVGTALIMASIGGLSASATLNVTGGSSANIMTLSVNGSLCSSATSASYLNKACVSVTVCNPGSATCTTVDDVLLDTGSYGFRLFKSAIPNLSLPAVTSVSGTLAECTQFADGTSVWGPIQLADVKLGGEPAVTIPIHVIDASFGAPPPACANADDTPTAAGFTGVLGLGVFAEDCGPGCAVSATNGIYYRCSGQSCSGTTVPLAEQVQNPVLHLPADNNGFLVQLPAVPPGGVFSTTGSVTLGIGTKPNNTFAAPEVFQTDANGDFSTLFNGTNNLSFLDTGSNGLFFPSSDRNLLPICPAPNSEWYCPPVTRSLLATTTGILGGNSETVSFQAGNFLVLMNSPNNVFSELAGPSAFGFDWGLPFFMGRRVFFGLEGRSSLGSTGPLVGF